MHLMKKPYDQLVQRKFRYIKISHVLERFKNKNVAGAMSIFHILTTWVKVTLNFQLQNVKYGHYHLNFIFFFIIILD